MEIGVDGAVHDIGDLFQIEALEGISALGDFIPETECQVLQPHP